MMHPQAVTVLLSLFLLLGLNGCDQAKELATKELEKKKNEVVGEITKTLKGGIPTGKKEAGSSKESEEKEEEHN